MKYLIVGLGNIGEEYRNTRHNIGFNVLDALAKASNLVFTDGRYGATATMSLKGRQLILLKPSTYMNLSGNAVRYWMQKENVPLGTQAYARLRFGIGNDFPRGGQIDFVLGHFTEEDMKTMDEHVELACEIIKSFCLAGINITMNQYNKK